jgi:hypothetical protein
MREISSPAMVYGSALPLERAITAHSTPISASLAGKERHRMIRKPLRARHVIPAATPAAAQPLAHFALLDFTKRTLALRFVYFVIWAFMMARDPQVSQPMVSVSLKRQASLLQVHLLLGRHSGRRPRQVLLRL